MISVFFLGAQNLAQQIQQENKNSSNRTPKGPGLVVPFSYEREK